MALLHLHQNYCHIRLTLILIIDQKNMLLRLIEKYVVYFTIFSSTYRYRNRCKPQKTIKMSFTTIFGSDFTNFYIIGASYIYLLVYNI